MNSNAYTSATITSTYTSIDNPEQLAQAVIDIHSRAEDLENAARILLASSQSLSQLSHDSSHCVNHTSHAEVTANCTHLYSAAQSQYHELTRMSKQLSSLSDKVRRSLSLYSAAEDATRGLLASVMQVGSAYDPLKAAGIMAMFGIARQGASGKFNPLGILTESQELQEPFLKGLGDKLSHGKGVSGTAQKLAAPFALLSDAAQGNTLSVHEIKGIKPLPQSHSVGSSLKNLKTLTDGELGTSYGTVAIQRYTDASGKHSWIVTIPGTDGKKDSPFGWAQNVDLMASSADKHALADSQQAVLQAMHKAGIKSDEKVTLVGHSQGGIIAASIASDKKLPYNVTHIVTAGSPIANHPINTQKTWVTSIETDKEIVSHLDGTHNPNKKNWLTITGHISRPATASTVPSSSTSTNLMPNSTPVKGASPQNEISHGMNYHMATYQDAEKLGSDELKAHESHFSRATEGTLDKSFYYECRLSRSK